MNAKCLGSVVIAMLFTLVSPGQSRKNDKVEQILTKMVQDHLDALQKADTLWLKYNFDDKYTYTNPLGMVVDKSAAINVLASGAIKLESSILENIVPYVYGDGGIVTDLSTIKGHIGNMDISGKYRYLYVFSYLNARWKIVAEQGTMVKQ